MKIFLITILTFLFFGFESNKPLKLKDLYGTWIDDSLYSEMLVSKSPYKSVKYIYNIKWLELKDSSWLHWYDEALPYKSDSLSENIIKLKCVNSEYDLNINVLNDSTLSYTDFIEHKKVILKKFNYYTQGFKNCDNEIPYYYYIKSKYFKGRKKLCRVEDKSKISIVNFISTCEVDGFLNYSNYRLFAGGIENTPNLDILVLETIKGKSYSFNYEISGDSIYIYHFKNKISGKNQDLLEYLDFLDSKLIKGKLLYILTDN